MKSRSVPKLSSSSSSACYIEQFLSLLNGKGAPWDLWCMNGSESGPRQTPSGIGQADVS